MSSSTARYPRFRWFILLAACLGNIGLQVNLIAYAPILNTIAADLRIGMGTATNLMAVFAFSGSLALIAGGVLCDRYGILFVLILGSLCGAVPACLLPWIGTSYGVVFWSRAVEGLAMGFCLCTISPIMAVWFAHRERGIAGGLIGTSMALGPALGVISSPAALAVAGRWQIVSAWLSAFSWAALLFALLLAVIPRPEPPSHEHSGKPAADARIFRRALSSPVTWILVMVLFFATWCLQTIYNIAPTYLAVNKPMGLGLGHMLSGKLMLSASVAGILAPIVGGILQDKVFHNNTKPLMYLGFALIGVFMLALLSPFVCEHLPVLALCLALSGAGIAVVLPAVTVFISLVYPMNIVGKILGLSMGLGGFGASAGLFAGGLAVAAFGNYDVAVMLISMAAAAGFVFVALLRGEGLQGAVQGAAADG